MGVRFWGRSVSGLGPGPGLGGLGPGWCVAGVVGGWVHGGPALEQGAAGASSRLGGSSTGGGMVTSCRSFLLFRNSLQEGEIQERWRKISAWAFTVLCSLEDEKMFILIPLLLFLSPVCGDLSNFTFYTDTYMTSWTKAQTFCRKYHTDLITIRNEQENTFFNGRGWIGLYRANTNTWKWSRGDEITSERLIIGSQKQCSFLNCVKSHCGFDVTYV
uniref:C-type lectin domain-containing protein n=1 Tax=Maylandia zebra TaxID=106582 RepID=A0A3P9CST1_9CICH